MDPEQQVAIWIHDEAARLFLATLRKPDEGETSAWFINGVMINRQAPIGVWVDVAYVEERRTQADGTRKTIRYGMKPGQCVVRWEYIIKVQLLEDAKTPPEDPRPMPGYL